MSKVTVKTIAQAAVDLLGSGISVANLSQTLAAYLVAERRTSELGLLTRQITELRAQNGIHEAILSSAFPLDDLIKKSISELIAKRSSGSKSVVIKTNQDPSLLGGVRVETHDLLLDTTMSSKLKHLYQLTPQS